MTPLPDEITYSFAAHAALLTGASDLRPVAVELFGSHSSFEYPAGRLHGGFQQLASHFVGFEEGGDVETLMNSLGFLLLFKPFLPDDQYSTLRQLSCKSGAEGLGKAAGIKRAGLLRHYAAICLDCLAYDKTTHHVGYYHRVAGSILSCSDLGTPTSSK